MPPLLSLIWYHNNPHSEQAQGLLQFYKLHFPTFPTATAQSPPHNAAIPVSVASDQIRSGLSKTTDPLPCFIVIRNNHIHFLLLLNRLKSLACCVERLIYRKPLFNCLSRSFMTFLIPYLSSLIYPQEIYQSHIRLFHPDRILHFIFLKSGKEQFIISTNCFLRIKLKMIRFRILMKFEQKTLAGFCA